MSQHEFEPREQADQELYQPHYPYTWSNQAQQEGMPRDEPPIRYGVPVGRTGYQDEQRGRFQGPQVPWWARPQPHQNGALFFTTIVAVAVLLVLGMGALGVAGVVLGSIAHIVGIIVGAIFALILFVFLLLFLVLIIIARVIRRAFAPPDSGGRRHRRF